jgi:hypothetical protein
MGGLKMMVLGITMMLIAIVGLALLEMMDDSDSR